MFLAPDGDEIEIANAAAEFLEDAMPIARLHRPQSADMDAVMRQRLGEMGWFAIALPEEQGGSGLSAVEYTLFFREVGRRCGPIDLLTQSLAAMTATETDLQASLITGESRVSLAVDDGSGIRLLGDPEADYALRVDREGARLFALSPDGTEERPALDPATSMRLLSALPQTSVAQSAGDTIWQMGELGVAAMLIGVAEAALDLIVGYAKIRETFGRKIGAYQAVRHPCADMALRAETARCQLWFAAAALKERRADAHIHLDAAKHLANQAAIANADANIQLHGGIGITDEHDAHLLLKHAMLLVKVFGSKRPLLARLLYAKAED